MTNSDPHENNRTRHEARDPEWREVRDNLRRNLGESEYRRIADALPRPRVQRCVNWTAARFRQEGSARQSVNCAQCGEQLHSNEVGFATLENLSDFTPGELLCKNCADSYIESSEAAERFAETYCVVGEIPSLDNQTTAENYVQDCFFRYTNYPELSGVSKAVQPLIVHCDLDDALRYQTVELLKAKVMEQHDSERAATICELLDRSEFPNQNVTTLDAAIQCYFGTMRMLGMAVEEIACADPSKCKRTVGFELGNSDGWFAFVIEHGEVLDPLAC